MPALEASEVALVQRGDDIIGFETDGNWMRVRFAKICVERTLISLSRLHDLNAHGVTNRLRFRARDQAGC